MFVEPSLFVLLLLVGVILAVFVAGYASERGGSGSFWGVFAFLAGPVWALVGLTALTEDERLTDDGTPEPVRLCPACSATHPGTPVYCRACGEALGSSDEVTPARRRETGSRTYCGNCGTATTTGAAACPDCEAVFVGEVTDPTDGPPRRCPDCGARHRGAPAHCPDCGQPLDADDDVPSAHVVRSGATGHCSDCRSQVPLDADGCDHCGAAF